MGALQDSWKASGLPQFRTDKTQPPSPSHLWLGHMQGFIFCNRKTCGIPLVFGISVPQKLR
jgi:hypothetical protein